jgi:acyl-CoA thioester hydrolase
VIHETTIRVRYGEVDRMGVVYHSHYLPYFEVGRTEFLRSLGRTYLEVEESGMLLVVADAGLKFHKPAGYDDVLRIRTRLASASGVRLVFEYEVDRPADGTRIATGHTTLAACDRSGRVMRIPQALLGHLDSVVEPAASEPAKALAVATVPNAFHSGKNRPSTPVQGRTS